MSPQFDVLELLQGGEVLWHRAAVTLAEAQQAAQQLAIRTQNPFFILDQRTGKKHLIDAPAAKPDARAELRQSL
jgi:hypothetical protein